VANPNPNPNPTQQVKAKHELALQHNDRSPLENMHCVMLYEVLRKGPTNIFANLSAAQWTESRKVDSPSPCQHLRFAYNYNQNITKT
jgi:hypothetical protein